MLYSSPHLDIFIPNPYPFTTSHNLWCYWSSFYDIKIGWAGVLPYVGIHVVPRSRSHIFHSGKRSSSSFVRFNICERWYCLLYLICVKSHYSLPPPSPSCQSRSENSGKSLVTRLKVSPLICYKDTLPARLLIFSSAIIRASKECKTALTSQFWAQFLVVVVGRVLSVCN